MTAPEPTALDERVLLLAPTARDAEMSRKTLAGVGIDCLVCKTLEEVCFEMGRGGGAAVLTQEAILSDRGRFLSGFLSNQPQWSDFPLVVLTPAGLDSALAVQALDAVGHMTLVQRPVALQVLVSTVRAALRDRRRQYATRDDLVERERQAEALRQRDERFRATFASSSVGMALATREGRFLEVNRAFCALTDYAPEELLETDPLAITHPDDREAHSRLHGRMLAGEIPNFGAEIRYVRKGGGVVWVKTSVSMIRDAAGAPTNVVTLTEDVTERKHAEAAKRESEDELRFALETARMGSWELDLATDTLTCTDACKANFGRKKDDPFTSQDLFEAIHPVDRDRVRELVRRAVESRSDYEAEYRVTWPDGGLHWVLARGQAFYRPGGERLRLVGLTLEITERKRAEEAMQDAARRKDEFLAMLAHELRNPLAAISGATQVFGAPDIGPEDLEWGRGVLERQVRQLSRLIDDLLDVSRINSGKIRLRRESFDVAPVLGSAVDVVRPLIDERKHELNVALTPGPIRVLADPTRVEQILVNLLANAAKYTQDGGQISVTVGLEGREVVFRVRDN
ncbi:MAG: PAS domain S-box protein, partial [Planctomycetia bacterium]|nr:PAS domain S-box protein [Planctomycetia bacterium]